MTERILHVYETEDRIYAGLFSKIENGKFTLRKGAMLMKNDLPGKKYSEENVKEFYLLAEKNNTIEDLHFSLEKIIKPHTIIL